MTPRRFALVIVLSMGLLAPVTAEAGVQGVPCSKPFVFKDAAVNVVVLPYETTPGLPTSGDLGKKLSALMQMESLRLIARFGSVGAVQMVGTAAECNPELVVDKLMGRKPGATAMLQKGRGLVVVWGRFFRQGDNVFIQSFCRLVRNGAEETLDLTVMDRKFTGQVSSQTFVCPPWQVTMADLQRFEEQFLRSNVLRSEPNEKAPGNPMPRETAPFWISDMQGDWMKLSGQGGMQGWVRVSGAQDPWSLVQWLPELKYVEGMAGYLRTRVAAGLGTTARPEWTDNAIKALTEYEAGAGKRPAVERDGTRLAGAVQMQLRGIMLASRGGDENLRAAVALFERADTLLVNDGHARNLLVMTRLALSRSGLKPAADGLFQALGADPANARVLANLQTLYEMLLGPPLNTGGSGSSAGAPQSMVTDVERVELTERLAAIKQIRAKTGR